MDAIEWPDGKSFAFSIVDDTDGATLEDVPAVYALLADLGFRTTKTVWTIDGNDADGLACDNRKYRAWVEVLHEQGFEIALHNVASRTSPRSRTIEGVERFHEILGAYPSMHINHASCRENIYWGSCRLTGRRRLAYDLLNPRSRRIPYEGHVGTSPLFWGDVCHSKIKYVRNFVHGDINTLRYCPEMPYHDPQRPYVRYWFASTEGPNVATFVRTLSDANIERLAAEGGACIMYTHFASGFAPHGELDPQFVRVMRRLSAFGGWFVPATTLLDHLQRVNGHREITNAARSRLERRWLIHKLRVGHT
jgi:hypothetical protein